MCLMARRNTVLVKTQKMNIYLFFFQNRDVVKFTISECAKTWEKAACKMGMWILGITAQHRG